jgi:4-hydroxy-3-methylbut-2-enyl diphosphate reductase
VKPEDLVIIPAFSAEVEDIDRLHKLGCEILDTTCPWVKKPHDRTLKNIRDGFTSIIHGMVHHDETRATCSLILSKSGHYLVVASLEEAEEVCAAIRGQVSSERILSDFREATSPGFDPEVHLGRIGLLNQTTMLASESQEIASRIENALVDRYGRQALAERFRNFDTICRATQENQDAVARLLASGELDLLIVLGGYDSSNTRNLARMGRKHLPTYHVQLASGIEKHKITHRDLVTGKELVLENWLPDGPVVIGFTAGASTPDTKLAEVIEKVLFCANGEKTAETV